MNSNDFFKQQQEAVSRMMEMNQRARKEEGSRPMPPVPPFVRVERHRQEERRPMGNPIEQPHEKPAQEAHTAGKNTHKKNNSLFGLGDLGLPFLDSFGKDADISLILGIMLIFLSEKSDKLLLMALAYILL